MSCQSLCSVCYSYRAVKYRKYVAVETWKQIVWLLADNDRIMFSLITSKNKSVPRFFTDRLASPNKAVSQGSTYDEVKIPHTSELLQLKSKDNYGVAY